MSPLNPFAAANFVKQRVANYKASNDDFGAWFVGGVSRYLGNYASARKQRNQVGSDLTKLTTKTALNFGCGYDKRPGHVNVDMDPACEPEVLVSVAMLDEFPSGHYQRILAKDVLEHIPRLRSVETLLRFSDWLAEGGTLELQTTSILGVADRIRKYPGFSNEFGMTQCMFGSQAHPGDFHYTGFTQTTLKVMLAMANLVPGDFELVDEWMFHFEAKKTSSWYQWADHRGSDEDFIRAVFDAALQRAPQPHEVTSTADVITRMSRRRAALEIFATPERMLATAKRLGV